MSNQKEPQDPCPVFRTGEIHKMTDRKQNNDASGMKRIRELDHGLKFVLTHDA